MTETSPLPEPKQPPKQEQLSAQLGQVEHDARSSGQLYGDPNKYFWEKTPKDWRALLAIEYGDHYRGNAVHMNEDGTRTSIRTYRFTFEEDEQPNYARQMISPAMEAGYVLATRPIRVTNSETESVYLGDDNHPAYELWLLFEERQGIDMQKPTGDKFLDCTKAYEAFKEPFVTQRGAIEGINWFDDRAAFAKLLNNPSYATSLRIPQAPPPTDQAEPNAQA